MTRQVLGGCQLRLPQGSVLGPILYIIYNSIPLASPSSLQNTVPWANFMQMIRRRTCTGSCF